jgi:hypothetical protein
LAVSKTGAQPGIVDQQMQLLMVEYHARRQITHLIQIAQICLVEFGGAGSGVYFCDNLIAPCLIAAMYDDVRAQLTEARSHFSAHAVGRAGNQYCLACHGGVFLWGLSGALGHQGQTQYSRHCDTASA